MDLKSSTPTTIRVTSAQKFAARGSFSERNELTALNGIPTPRRAFRETDPPSKTIGELTPEDYNKRLVIRSGDFLGTVYGTLLSAAAHPNLRQFTIVQLWQKKELTFRNDMEALVLDDEIRPAALKLVQQ